MITIKISGVYYPVLIDTYSLELTLGERSLANFEIKDEVGVHFAKGSLVEIYDNDKLEFTGYTEGKPQERRLRQGVMIHSITAADGHYLADKRIIAKAYENELAGDIVKDIIIEKLADEGITTTLDSTQQTWIMYTGNTFLELSNQGGN